MKNLELKAKCGCLDSVRRQLIDLNAKFSETVKQNDTYFNVPKGRLKLREINGSEAYLVYYERLNSAASCYSTYQLWNVTNQAGFMEILTTVLGVKVIVEKQRELWVFGDTRIHLDRVMKLGEFVELETVIRNQTELEAWMEHQSVKEAIGIMERDLIAESYSDLL